MSCFTTGSPPSCGLSMDNDSSPSNTSRRNSLSDVSVDLESSENVYLVTGGAGFIGSHVSDYLLSRGDKVVIVDEMNDYYDVRLKESNLNYLSSQHSNNLKFVVYRGDICDKDFIDNIFKIEKITHVCHLAARAGVRASIADPFIYVHSNVEGTTRLLDLSRLYRIKNFVYASSSSVYGCSNLSLLSEDDVVEKPVSPYAATKKACELLAYTYHHLYGMNCTGLRFFTVYGPRGRPDMAPFKFIDRVYNSLPIQQYGDGSTSRDYTYIDDIVDGVVRAIDRPLGYEVINLGNGRPFQLKAFIQLVEESVGKKAIIELCPEQPGDVERTCANINKAKSLLGYDPKTPFEIGISLTAQWYKNASSNGLFDSNEVTSSSNETLVPIPSISKQKSIDKLKRSESDLELSSFVEKATRQVHMRMKRFFNSPTK